MILHIFTQVSDYSVEFLKLLADNFQLDQHTIVFRNGQKKYLLEGKSNSRLLFIESRRDLIKEMPPLLKEAKRIIFHSFPVSRSLIFWYGQREYFKKAIWSVWGQDAYWFKYCKKSPENLVYEWIRKQLINKLNIIFCPINGDYQYILKQYNTRASFKQGMYPIPTDFKVLERLRRTREKGKELYIQVGNSANPTNNTLEVLHLLKKHLDHDFKVFCPLSYGDLGYAKRVIAYGRRELKDHFVPMTTFLDKNEYARFIASMDVLIMNHDRQQGLGNIFSYLFLGKKVYIRSNNSSFSFFGEQGIKVYDTRELLENDNFGQLYEFDDQEDSRNMCLTEDIVSFKKITTDWEAILT